MATGGECDEIICALCLEIYSDPRLLPCYHTFCKTCIEQLINKGEEQGKFSCPLCRSAITSTEFPSNIYIQTRVAFNNEKIKCDLCESDENITVKCIDCDQLLCENCSSIHRKIKVCKEHRVIEYTGSDIENSTLKAKKNSFCPKHPQEILRFHCVECDIPVCRDCKHTKHEGHKSEDIEDRVEDAVNWMKVYINKVEIEMRYFDKKVQLLSNMKNKFEENSVNVSRTVDKIEQELHTEIMEECAKIKSEIKQISDEQIQYVIKSKNDVEIKISRLTSKKKYVDQIICSGPDADMFLCKSQLSSEQTKLPFTVQFVMKFPTFCNERSKIKFGHIKENKIYVGINIELKESFVADMMNKSVSAICLKSDKEGLLLFRSDAWNQGSRIKNVIAYCSSGLQKEAYVIPPQMDLVVDKDGRIYFYEDRLEKIEGGLTAYLKPGEENKTENIYPCKRPISMDTISSGDIIILDIENKLSLIDFDQKKTIFSFEEGHLTSPISVASSSDDRLWVADPGSGQVIVFDTDGQLVFKFDVCQTLKLSNKSKPNSICFCELFNVVVVADSMNNCIFTISGDGSYAEIVLDGSIDMESPSCVACKENVLWVCDKKSRIRIFEMLKP